MEMDENFYHIAIGKYQKTLDKKLSMICI